MKNDFIKSKLNNKKQSNNKKPSYYIVLGLMLFCVIGSLLGSIAFAQNCSKTSSSNVAYADETTTTYEYIGNNIFMPSTYGNINRNSNNYSENYFDLSVDVEIFGSYTTTILGYPQYLFNVPKLNLKAVAPYIYDGAVISSALSHSLRLTDYSNYDFYPLNANNANIIENITFYALDASFNQLSLSVNYEDIVYLKHEFDLLSDYPNIPYSGNYGSFDLIIQRGFNNNVVKVSLSSQELTSSNVYVMTNTITYYDTNNNILQLVFYSVSQSYTIKYFSYEYRTYYLGNVTDEDFYKEGYQNATNEWETKYNNKVAELENKYNTDIENTKIEYENKGYLQGLENASNYSFLSLFTSLIDAPIQALTGLLNFEVLGFNLFDLVTALITIALIIFVVRLFL